MKKIAICAFFCSAAAFAQTAEIGYFRAVMLPSKEVPVVNVTNVSGVADILAHVVRDRTTGQIISGTVQFLVHVNFPAEVAATGLHIHSGGPTVAGPVVIGTSLSAGSPQQIKTGGDIVNLPVQVTGDGLALTSLRGLFDDPGQFYVNIHTTEFPGGIMRGQLKRAIGTVLMGMMNSQNEVPVQNVEASGVATVIALGTLDASGGLESGVTYLQTTYKVADGGTISGFHIHPGAAGGTGPASLQAALPTGSAAIPVDPAGGVIGPFYSELNLSNAVQVQTFLNLFFNPSGDYINMHTAPAHTGGVIRAQLRPTDSMVFPVLMDSANEVGDIKFKGTAPALITVRTLRNEDGSVAAGFVMFDVNYRFSGAANFTGLHIHDAPAGTNGSISIPIVPGVDAPFSSDTGFGNYFNWTPPVTNLSVLEDITKNPENHYVNIHTTMDPGGSARAQLAPAVTTAGQIDAVISANNDKAATTVAPGGLLTIYGARLVKIATDLSGWAGRTLPTSLNGTSVTIGGKAAPLLYVGPGQINAQVPVDVAPGQQAVIVRSVVGPSGSFNVNVAATAPAIFFSPVAAVLKNSDFSLVTAANPARSGDVILVYATGLGQTTPPITTGGLVPADMIANTATATATIGGQDAKVIYSIASPGFAGLNQVALTVPSGVSGSVPVVITQGTTKSNAVNIAVQ
jgi:uncharacterized protein (TIGR03437 family)